MKLIKILTIIGTVCIVSCQTNTNSAKSITKESLKTESDSVSYAAGSQIGKSVLTSFEDINNEVFIAAYLQAMDSVDLLIDEAEGQKIIQNYMTKNREKIMKKQQEANAKKLEKDYGHIKEEGEKFLKANVANEGVLTTDSGLQYIVLKEGSGEKPTEASKVKVHYHGTLIDGTVFDSSVDRGEPTEFGVTQVIKGWTEGLQLMSKGAKYKFFIPQELAYGATPRGGSIKPFSMLIFEVELLDITNE